ncbi:unnamed protein product [Urochloa humidicola]
MEELHGIVIVGGGISGLATALALHRKGISSLVLERSETLRTDGVCISIHANGWRALDQLGIGTELRETTNSITGYQNVWLNQKRTTLQSTSTEIRCLKQKDLIEALAKPLPPGTIRFGCHVAAISADPGGHWTLIRTVDGSTIRAKALIGCDGVKSEVSKYLGLGIASELPRLTILGLTSYPHGHPYGTQFLQLHGEELIVGRVPLNENLVHFFISRASPSKDIDVTAAKEYVLEKLKEFPADITEMVLRCDPEKELLKTLTRVWYRPPWQVLFGRFQMGTVVVAGDAMHAMGPFIGQAGSAALEDAVVLARSVSRALPGGVDAVADDRELHEKISAALGKYVRERRTRVFMLSLEAFVTGSLLTAKALAKYLVLVPILIILGSESRRNANYDCGRL